MPRTLKVLGACMKIRLLILAAFLVSCSPTGKNGEILAHVPVSVGGITYQWPVDGSPELRDPTQWKGHGVISAAIWNGTIGEIAALRADPKYGKEIYLTVAKSRDWNIEEDGKGLPLFASERYSINERKERYSLGIVEGDGIVSPSTVIIYNNEPNAYTVCRPPTGLRPSGSCVVFLNDQGVQHSISLPYGEWASVPTMLRIYKQLLGIPAGSSR